MKIIIVGAGFAGIRLAKRLSNKKGFEVLLIDKFNHHQFQPLFYQVAMAGLDVSDVSFPLRKLFHKSKNIHIRLAEVTGIKSNEKKIVTTGGEFDYDMLVLASGTEVSYFGNASLQQYAFPMKSTIDALDLRNHLLGTFETALFATSEEEKERLLTVVVIGAGPTGVEVSGAIAEMKRYVLPKDFPELDFNKMKIYLLEGGSKTLSVMSSESSKASQKHLEKLGVIVKTETLVENYDGKTVFIKGGETINSATVVWAAGLQGNIPLGFDSNIIARGKRLKTDLYNKVIGYEDIYALGDIASMETEQYPNGHPQLAPVANQQADNLAYNLLHPNHQKPFEFNNFGSMATIGRNMAVVDIAKPKLHFNGFFAWLIWMFLHLMYILGVKNKLFVFYNWLYNYFTYDQSLRFIFKRIQQEKT